MTVRSDRGYAEQERRYLAAVDSSAVVDQARDLLHEGRVRRLVVKDARGRRAIDMPVIMVVVLGVVAPVLSAAAALIALARGWTFRIERREDDELRS
jgi:hypothetical protein